MGLKVLIPIDHKATSRIAVDYAVELNSQVKLSVTLLNVIDGRTLNGRGINQDLIEMVGKQQRIHAASVLEKTAKTLKEAKIDVHQQIEYGSPGSVICRTALESGYDMVLITESGYSELGELLLGSVVSYVTHKCRIPVLLLKKPEK